MKKFICLFFMLFFSAFCLAQDENFKEEFIDIDLGQTPIQNEKTEELNKTSEEEQNKINEFNFFKEQNEKEISEIQRQIEQEEDGIVRLELENQIKTKKIEYQAKKYVLDWNDEIEEDSIQKVLNEAVKIKKQTSKLLDSYENVLETKSDFLLDKDKMLVSEDQNYELLEESIIVENKNKTLISMINTLKPFIKKLHNYQNNYFKSDGNNKVKISSLYKNNSNYMNIKIIYISEQTVIYNLKYKISTLSKEEQALIGKTAKDFKITPMFSVTQNNNNTLTKVLTGFKVENAKVDNEQIVKVSANIKEIYEITRYKKLLKQYNEE